MIHLRIITPTGLYKELDIDAIHLKTAKGEATILPNHMPIVAMLEICECDITMKSEVDRYALAGGLMQFENNQMNILTDAIESQSEIDANRAQKALERAKKRLSDHSDSDVKRAEIALAKAMNRLKLKNIQNL